MSQAPTVTVAVLYTDPLGPYPKMPGVDSWDAKRDARLYEGPHPIVAHPPCGPWSKLKHFYQGMEHDCAIVALDQVRRFGGVLEHPAHSGLWKAFGLPKPDTNTKQLGLFDSFGFSIEVCQVDFGHVARKRTWLYFVGVSRGVIDLPPKAEPTHWASGGRKAVRGPVPQGIKVCSAQQRRRTPPAFAEWLVALAKQAKP